MLEILTVGIFVWLMVKAVRLMLRLTWGAAKLVAGILMVAALPILAICLIFASGVALLIPIAVIGIVIGILKSCL